MRRTPKQAQRAFCTATIHGAGHHHYTSALLAARVVASPSASHLAKRALSSDAAEDTGPVSTSLLAELEQQAKERAAEGVVPRPLDAQQVARLTKALEVGGVSEEENAELLRNLTHRVPPGVDDAAYVKASWLTAVSKGEIQSPLVSAYHAVELLGTMQGGYNITGLVAALDDPELSKAAVPALKDTLLMFDAFYDVDAKRKEGNEAEGAKTCP